MKIENRINDVVEQARSAHEDYLFEEFGVEKRIYDIEQLKSACLDYLCKKSGEEPIYMENSTFQNVVFGDRLEKGESWEWSGDVSSFYLSLKEKVHHTIFCNDDALVVAVNEPTSTSPIYNDYSSSLCFRCSVDEIGNKFAELDIISTMTHGSELISIEGMVNDINKIYEKKQQEQVLDNLADVKMQDFIDAQGLSDDLHAPQHVDAEFAKPVLNFKDIKTVDDAKLWAKSADESIKCLVSEKELPTKELIDYVQKEHDLFGDVDKNMECSVVRIGDKSVLLENVVHKMIDENLVDVEHINSAVRVWMNDKNNPNLKIDDRYIQAIQENDKSAILACYLAQMRPNEIKGENVFYDKEILQNLIDEQYIDDINQNATSREFEILSDGEEIPFDVSQGQADKSLENKSANKNKNNQKNKNINRQKNYKRTDQWLESSTGHNNVKSPKEMQEYAKRMSAEINARNKQQSQDQQKQYQEKKKSNNSLSR